MPDHEEAPPAVADPRVSTGCGPLDKMLSGGLVPRRPYLVVGASGTGKTTLALEFLCEGIRRGERCLVVTLEEPPNEIRTNHRNLSPELDEVYVFDAIPDVMRYERAPFKDIAAVRQSVPFKEIPFTIRRSPELASVEVTFTALEQTLKMEMARRNYSRMVIDSLTALQYFCMKGFDETLGAQTFLRFLSDLHVTTLLTVEAPLEDVETPERLLARGEIRLFRWELDSRTVRAIGVEKFRGSPHDNTLHPYRISPRGLDINLDVTISRDTRALLPSGSEPTAIPIEEFATGLAALEQDSRDLAALSADVGPVRAALLQALVAAREGDAVEVARAVVRARGRVLELAEQLPLMDAEGPNAGALRRLRARSSAARTGVPPFAVPDPVAVRPGLESILKILELGPPPPDLDRRRLPHPAPAAVAVAEPAPAPAPVAPSAPSPPPVPAAATTVVAAASPVPAPAPAPVSDAPVPPPAAPAPAASPALSEAPRPHVPFPAALPLDPRSTPSGIPPAPPPLPRGEPPPMPAAIPRPRSTAPVAPPTPATTAPPARAAVGLPVEPAPAAPPAPPPLPRPVEATELPTGPGPIPPDPEPRAAQGGGGGGELAPVKRRRKAPTGAAPRKRTARKLAEAPAAPIQHEPPAPEPSSSAPAPVAAPATPEVPPVKKRRAPRKKPAPAATDPAAGPTPGAVDAVPAPDPSSPGPAEGPPPGA